MTATRGKLSAEYAAWMSPSGTRHRPLDSLRQFTVTQSSHVLVAAEIKSVGFMAMEKTGAPFAGSARCSLLGEAQRFAVGHSLRETPKLLVELDVAVEAGDCPRACKPLSVDPPARLVLETATAQIFLELCEAGRYVE